MIPLRVFRRSEKFLDMRIEAPAARMDMYRAAKATPRAQIPWRRTCKGCGSPCAAHPGP